MSRSLRIQWQKQLEAASVDPSLKAQAEVRVLRFLLSRYRGQQDAAPLTSFPLYEGQPVRGRARMLLSRREQHQRLEEIAEVRRETDRAEEQFSWRRELMIDLPARIISESAYNEMMRQRRKRQRGYW